MNGRMKKRKIKRTQTGFRMESDMLKVLKGLAEYLDITLGDLMEGIVLHVFEGKAPFSEETLCRIDMLKKVFDLELTAEDSHQLVEAK